MVTKCHLTQGRYLRRPGMKGVFWNGQVQPMLLFCAVILFQLNCTEQACLHQETWLECYYISRWYLTETEFAHTKHDVCMILTPNKIRQITALSSGWRILDARIEQYKKKLKRPLDPSSNLRQTVKVRGIFLVVRTQRTHFFLICVNPMTLFIIGFSCLWLLGEKLDMRRTSILARQCKL